MVIQEVERAVKILEGSEGVSEPVSIVLTAFAFIVFLNRWEGVSIWKFATLQFCSVLYSHGLISTDELESDWGSMAVDVHDKARISISHSG